METGSACLNSPHGGPILSADSIAGCTFARGYFDPDRGWQPAGPPFSTIILHHFRGAATRVPLAATAFGLRQEHFMVEVIAAWESCC